MHSYCGFLSTLKHHVKWLQDTLQSTVVCFFFFFFVSSGRFSLISAFRVKHSVAQLCGNLFCFLKLATIRWTHIWCCANAWSHHSFSCSNLLKNVHTRRYSIDDKNCWKVSIWCDNLYSSFLVISVSRLPVGRSKLLSECLSDPTLLQWCWSPSCGEARPWLIVFSDVSNQVCTMAMCLVGTCSIFQQGGDPRHFTDLSILVCCHNSFSSPTNPQMTEPPCLQVVEDTRSWFEPNIWTLVHHRDHFWYNASSSHDLGARFMFIDPSGHCKWSVTKTALKMIVKLVK